MGCSSAAGDQDKALTLTKTALLRVNYEVSSLKLFAHLAFPHSPTLENTPKQPSFHGRMDGRFSLVLCADIEFRFVGKVPPRGVSDQA